MVLWSYGISSTDVSDMVLCVSYVVSGTELGYATTRSLFYKRGGGVKATAKEGMRS